MKILPLVACFSSFNVFGLAFPFTALSGKRTPSSLDQKTGDNAPAVRAGTISNAVPLISYPRDLIPRHNAVDDITRWCIGNNPTYLELNFVRVIQGTAVYTLCHAAQLFLAHRLHEHGDGPVVAGFFNFLGANGIRLHMHTAAESTLTWQQMDTALETLYDYMVRHHFGAITFKIFSGATQVGEGSIE